MVKLKHKKLYIIYLLVFACFGLNFQLPLVYADEVKNVDQSFEQNIFEIEINENLDFNNVKKQVLKKDLKYVVNPDILANDIRLSEITVIDIDYASFDVQQVVVEVSRFIDSKAHKVQIDTINQKVAIKFIDTLAPKITLKKNSVTLIQDEIINVEDYLVEVSDNSYDELIVDIKDDIDFETPGKYSATFTAFDASNNTSSEILTVIIKEKPKPKVETFKISNEIMSTSNSSGLTVGSIYKPNRLTRYGFDCRGCQLKGPYFSSTAAGINIGDNRVRQANGQWQSGLTYEGYYIVAASRSIPIFSILKISDHPFSGSGINAGEPFYAIVGDRGVSGSNLDLFIGSEKNINAIRQRGNPSSSNTQIEIVRWGR